MSAKEMAYQYMDTLAKGLQIIIQSDFHLISEICAFEGYSDIAKDVKQRMDSFWSLEKEKFLRAVEGYINGIKTDDDNVSRIAKAIEFCKWLDMRITYTQCEVNSVGEKTNFSIYSLIPLCGDDYVEIGSLNSNIRETGIWINPKYGIASPHVIRQGSEEKKLVANRDAFKGINGELHNCSYLQWDEKRKIKNIILQPDYQYKEKKNIFRIVYAPLSDKHNHLQEEQQYVWRNGVKCKGIGVTGINDAECLYERLKNDWLSAGEIQADLFFAPEMLGTELTEQSEGEYNNFISCLSEENMRQGKDVSKLSILPSYWHQQKNSATILFQDGRIIGKCEKRVAYLDKKENKIEALKELEQYTIILIHVSGIHRIAVVICAEFLEKDTSYIEEILCGSLGVTLLIVPSYSPGEQDFINSLSKLKCYGTTVVWGNCCGAIASDEKGIGGCGVAGINSNQIFGKKCKCNNSCDGIQSCIFQIDLPLDFQIQKNSDLKYDELVQHKIKRG